MSWTRSTSLLDAQGVGRQSKVGGYPAEQIDPARSGVDVRGEDLVHSPSVILGKSSLRGILAPCSQVCMRLTLMFGDNALATPNQVAFHQPLARLISEHAIDLWLGKQGVNEHQPGPALHRRSDSRPHQTQGSAQVDMRHLMASVIMTAPGAIMLSKMVIPETGMPETSRAKSLEAPDRASLPNDSNGPVNVIDAAARGASEGLILAANVAAMLIAFIALIALVNGIWSSLRDVAIQHTTGSLQQIVTAVPLTIQQLLGYAFAPIAFITGVPWGEAVQVGNLLGTRIVLNEFVGYIELGKIKALLSPKSFMISTYLLCGFGSLTSIAIMAGGVGALVPSRRAELAALGLKAVLIGVMSNILAASIAGVLF